MSETTRIEAKEEPAKRTESVSPAGTTSSIRSSGSPASVICGIQKAAGNVAVQRMLKGGRIQAKLRIGEPDDIYEKEADHVAERIMQMPEPATVPEPRAGPASPPIAIHRKCTRCQDNDDEKKIIRKTSGTTHASSEVPSIVHEVLGSSGQPLDHATRTFFEPRFGYNFGRVRIHAGSRAAESARAINALAYTAGTDIVFGAGIYSSGTSRGNSILAHELTHVIQQNGADVVSPLPVQTSRVQG